MGYFLRVSTSWGGTSPGGESGQTGVRAIFTPYHPPLSALVEPGGRSPAGRAAGSPAAAWLEAGGLPHACQGGLDGRTVDAGVSSPACASGPYLVGEHRVGQRGPEEWRLSTVRCSRRRWSTARIRKSRATGVEARRTTLCPVKIEGPRWSAPSAGTPGPPATTSQWSRRA
jgi:hypothetical protein